MSGTEMKIRDPLSPGCWCNTLLSATAKEPPASFLILTAGSFNVLCSFLLFKSILFIIFSVPSQLLLLILQRLKDGHPPSVAVRALSSTFAPCRFLRLLPTPASSFFYLVSRSSDLSALWNMKGFARHRLLLEPVEAVNHDASMPRSKL